MRPEQGLARPIFIVGCGRSGTTVLYDMLCGHPELAWFSNYTERWPGVPRVAFLSRFYRYRGLRRLMGGRGPSPVEGYPLWDRCRPVVDSPGDPPLTEADLREADAREVRRTVARHVRYQGASRFINKNTRNTRRIRYLNAIFGDALFIHVIRDPRATVNSLLNVAFWPFLKVWCQDKVTPREWQASGGRDPAILAARLWTAEVQRALDDAKSLPADRYLEIRYEQLTADPVAVVSRILEFADLDWNEPFARFIDDFQVENRNSKYQRDLDDSRIADIETETSPLAWRLGYSPRFAAAAE